MNEPANIARIHADSQDHALRKSLGYYGKSGRQSFVEGEVVGGPTTFSQIRGLLNGYAPLGYMLPWETLDYVEILATYNPDYSQAVENIKMLSNSGHELMVSSSSDLATRRLKARLETKARTLQEGHGGIDGIIDKLMDQAATYGAMCGEIVLSDDLSDVVDFVDLNPKKIRFFWDEDLGKYMPYQKVSAEQAKKAESRGQKTINNCIALNPLTFRYYAFDAAPESPYGTPPFLAALYNIAIQRDLVANMAQIVKKIGLLGIIDVEVERLAVQPGETDEAYVARAREYLSGYAEAAGEMAKEGGLTHFDDVKVTTTQLGGNAAGATNIHKANEEMVFSGLKSMPSLQGRSFSTTETYAGVAYEITLRNTAKYQRAAKRIVESMYWMMADLWGERPTSIKIQFNTNRALNRIQEAQAEQAEINNAIMLWIIGILDQTGVAQKLGYADVSESMEHPPESVVGSYVVEMSAEQQLDFDNQQPTSAKMEEIEDDEQD